MYLRTQNRKLSNSPWLRIKFHEALVGKTHVANSYFFRSFDRLRTLYSDSKRSWASAYCLGSRPFYIPGGRS